MPSGSHRGGGGRGHSGGGSRGGSSFRSSSSGRSSSGSSRGFFGRYYHRGPRYFYFGRRRYYISAGRSSALNVLGVLTAFAIFVAFVAVFLLGAASSEVSALVDDQAYYLDMISYAEQNPTVRIRTATVTDCFQGANTDKWQIIYTLPTDSGGDILEGESYYVYTRQQAMALLNQGTIEVAINKNVVDLTTDSMPMDYKNMALEDDGEYVAAKALLNIGTVVLVVAGVIVAVSIVAQVLVSFSKRAEESTGGSGAKSSTTYSDTKETYCNYCGARMSEGDKKCPSCGSSGR